MTWNLRHSNSLILGSTAILPSVACVRQWRFLQNYERFFEWQPDITPKLFGCVCRHRVRDPDLPQLVHVLLLVLYRGYKFSWHFDTPPDQASLAALLEASNSIHERLNTGQCVHFVNTAVRRACDLPPRAAASLVRCWVSLCSDFVQSWPLVCAICSIHWRDWHAEDLFPILQPLGTIIPAWKRAFVLQLCFGAETRNPDVWPLKDLFRACTKEKHGAKLMRVLDSVPDLPRFATLMATRYLSRHCIMWCALSGASPAGEPHSPTRCCCIPRLEQFRRAARRVEEMLAATKLPRVLIYLAAEFESARLFVVRP
jgi:hypothetical protein